MSEDVAVVLRRQVPPRLDEAPRSWLGGVPQMAEDIAWPRSISAEYPERGERPLHFLAQICCADLPAKLWGALGPRDGWLLVFVDPNQGCPDGSDAFRVLHIAELGPPRQPPFDLGPVHDGVYTGGSYRWLAPDQIPSTWRRWPVDLVSVPNRLVHDQQRSFATAEGFAGTLYEGAPVAADDSLRALPPYTFGQALRAVRTLIASMGAEPAPVTNAYSDALLETPGSLDALRVTLADNIARTRERPDTPYRAGQLDGLERRLALVEGCASPAELRHALESARERHREWRAAMAADAKRLGELLAAQPPETTLSQEDWDELQASFAGREWPVLDLMIEYPTGQPKHLDLRERLEQVRLSPPAGVREEAVRDWLDPATRARVPAEVIGDLEAWCRRLTSNRPHRMGGYHDGVQSDAVEGPQERLLLFQIASDDAMDWCWGDVGAYYFWIRPRHLAAGDYSGVEMDLESH